MYAPYVPNSLIVDRAVTIWKRLLARPKYDNGDRSEAGLMGIGLMAMQPNNCTPEILEKFGVELRSLLMSSEDIGGKPYYDPHLHVDYHPDKRLSRAAEGAGLEMLFPIKSSMWLHNDHISYHVGYGAPDIYEYPLPDGRWLRTQLCGADMPKVIEYVMGGKPEFDIEEAVAPAERNVS